MLIFFIIAIKFRIWTVCLQLYNDLQKNPDQVIDLYILLQTFLESTVLCPCRYLFPVSFSVFSFFPSLSIVFIFVAAARSMSLLYLGSVFLSYFSLSLFLSLLLLLLFSLSFSLLLCRSVGLCCYPCFCFCFVSLSLSLSLSVSYNKDNGNFILIRKQLPIYTMSY